MKTRNHTVFLFVLIFALTCRCPAGQNRREPQSNCVFKCEFVTSDDGIQLATDTYLPRGPGPFACVLIRTPYNMRLQAVKNTCRWFAEKGLAVVAQDCRGKFLSEGHFHPFRNERRDGLATLKWVRKQPWANGRIGGWGGSYVGYTQWAVADRLDVLTAELTGAELYELVYPGGLFSLDLIFRWAFAVDAKTSNPVSNEKLAASFSILPLSVADDQTYRDNPFINDLLAHAFYDSYWASLSHRGPTNAAVLSIAGWYDIFLMTQINDFQALTDQGHTDNRLVIGPWCHGRQAFKDDYGGTLKTGNRDQLARRFLLKHLKSEQAVLMAAPLQDKKYNLFIMQRNEYYGADQWPPKAVTFTDYYLAPDGSLDTKIPDDHGTCQYTYNPKDPYPNRGGTLLGTAVGPALQNDNVSRPDQAVFETNILKQPFILLGPISACLHVDSDVPQTDFIVCLQDVFPNGNIINIQEGGTTVNWKKPGVRKANISIWATGYQLDTGHKLRAVVTSSWFPRFNRNLNCGESIFSATTIKTAHQKIYSGPEHPSYVSLPMLRLPE